MFVSLSLVVFLLFTTVRGENVNPSNNDRPLNLTLKEAIEPEDPDATRTVPELITSKGYPFESYDVVTSDGYILELHRIPPKRPTNEVVFLMHPLTSSSGVYVINLANQSLGFILHDRGYDVWLGNARGNPFSRRHKILDPFGRLFWMFSVHDIATKDVPAMIDYVLEKTNQRQLHYIGMSMGTTVSFILLSQQPEYNQKMKSVMFMAPVANVTYMWSPIKYIVPLGLDKIVAKHSLGAQPKSVMFMAPVANVTYMWSPIKYIVPLGLDKIVEKNSNGAFIVDKEFIDFILDRFCFKEDNEICNIYQIVTGFNLGSHNKSRLDVYSTVIPVSTSWPTIVHYAQNCHEKRFQAYDWGVRANLIKYGQETPIEYDISKITSKISLFTTLNDEFTSPTELTLWKPKIMNLDFHYRVPDVRFTHNDFVVSIDAAKLVYPALLRQLSKYRG